MVDIFDRTLDAAGRAEQMARMMKFLSDEVPAIPVYFVLRSIAHVATLQGPVAGSPQSTRNHHVRKRVFR